MRTIQVVQIKKILEKLTFMKLKKIKTVFNDEDGVTSCYLYYFTSLDNVEKITISSYLWTTLDIKLTNSEETIKIFSDNLNSQDKSLLRQYTNNILSPSFKINDNSIILNSNIETWLNNIGFTELTYDTLNIMGKYKFDNGIKIEKQENCTVKKYNQTIYFSEKEIEELLSKIDTDLSNKLRLLFNEERLIY